MADSKRALQKAEDARFFLFLKDLVQLEEREEAEEVRRELETMSPGERELRGRALLDLELESRTFGPGGHRLVSFRRARGEDLPLFTLEPGDVVVVFSAKDSHAECPTATVYEKEDAEITLAFDRPLPDWLTDEGTRRIRVHLHKSQNRATYRRIFEVLDAIRTAKDTRLAHFRDISLGIRKPVFSDHSAKIKFFDEGLNASQRTAVERALGAADVALVHGPPGTGKTTVLVEIVRQTVASGGRVLMCAPSNTACDNALEKLVQKGVNALRLGHPARITASLREHTLDFKLARHERTLEAMRLQADLERLFRQQERQRDRRPGARDEARSARENISEMKDEIRQLRAEALAGTLKETEVFVGTLTSSLDRTLSHLDFDLAIIDEATQAIEPLTWIPFSRAEKVVLAGDHLQLPPTIRSKEAEEKGLDRTLFERLHGILPEKMVTLLERQYRMNEAIAGFSSREFYKGKLKADESVAEHVLADLIPGSADDALREPLVFIDTAGKGFEEKLELGSESRYNAEEAELVLSQLRHMISLGVKPHDIGVICPYSAQVRYIASRWKKGGVEIDSVDGFQGREKELILVSLVRSNLEGEMGFLSDTRRMNVAMTRARRKLIVVGDSATISSLPFYRDFLKYVEEAGIYRSAWELD